jgi:hypothetical protein
LQNIAEFKSLKLELEIVSEELVPPSHLTIGNEINAHQPVLMVSLCMARVHGSRENIRSRYSFILCIVMTTSLCGQKANNKVYDDMSP